MRYASKLYRSYRTPSEAGALGQGSAGSWSLDRTDEWRTSNRLGAGPGSTEPDPAGETGTEERAATSDARGDAGQNEHPTDGLP